jgi:hypothetical protein
MIKIFVNEDYDVKGWIQRAASLSEQLHKSVQRLTDCEFLSESFAMDCAFIAHHLIQAVKEIPPEVVSRCVSKSMFKDGGIISDTCVTFDLAHDVCDRVEQCVSLCVLLPGSTYDTRTDNASALVQALQQVSLDWVRVEQSALTFSSLNGSNLIH